MTSPATPLKNGSANNAGHRKFANAIIELLRAYALRSGLNTPEKRVVQDAEVELLSDADRLDSNERINNTNRPKPNPHRIAVTLACGHGRDCASHIVPGIWIRCHACNATRQVMTVHGSPTYNHVSCVPVAEYAALRELLRRVDMAEYGLAGREQPPLVQSVFNQLYAMRCKGFAP